jgi:hypothetical protein
LFWNLGVCYNLTSGEACPLNALIFA